MISSKAGTAGTAGRQLSLLSLLSLLSPLFACTPGAPPFQQEATLATRGGTNPTTAVGADGTIYVAWVGQDDSTTANVYLVRSEGDGFSQPVRVNDKPGDAAPHSQAPARVALGKNQDVYVSWQSTRPVAGLMFGAADVRVARSTDGGRTFGPAATANDDWKRLDARHSFHDVLAAPDGSIYVSWIDARHRDSVRVEAAKKNKGAHLHASSGGMPAGGAVKRPGEPTVDIRIARSTDGGQTFAMGVVVDTNSCTCCRTALAADSTGGIYLAWRKFHPGDVNDIVVARSADQGRTWSAPVKAHDDGWVFPGCPHAGPDLHIDAENAVHITWYTGAPDRLGLYYAVSRDQGKSFSQPVALLADVPVSQATVTAAGPNAVWIGWEDRRTDTLRVGLAWADNRGAFRRYEALALPGTEPNLAGNGSRVALAWLDREMVKVRTGQ